MLGGPIPETAMRAFLTLLALLALPAQAADGRQVFEQLCASCHVPGKDGAPLLGDRKAWGLRLKQGREELYANAYHGRRKTPAGRGERARISAEIQSSVDYMLREAGY